MTYTFRTRCELVKNLSALCELSGSVAHSSLPMKDFVTELPYLLDYCVDIKRLSKINQRQSKIYIAFRTLGFECSLSFSVFKSRLACFSSVIACYTITFVDGYYTLEKFEL